MKALLFPLNNLYVHSIYTKIRMYNNKEWGVAIIFPFFIFKLPFIMFPGGTHLFSFERKIVHFARIKCHAAVSLVKLYYRANQRASSVRATLLPLGDTYLFSVVSKKRNAQSTVDKAASDR